MFPILYPLKNQKISGFLLFLWDIKWEHWAWAEIKGHTGTKWVNDFILQNYIPSWHLPAQNRQIETLEQEVKYVQS